MTGLGPEIQYVLERISEGGDRYDAIQFCFGARIFDPKCEKTLTTSQAHALINKMATYPIFNKGGANSIIARLKRTCPAYHKSVSQVAANFGNDMRNTKHRSRISEWKYRMSLCLETEVLNDSV